MMHGNIHQCGQCKWCRAIFTNVGSVSDAVQYSPMWVVQVMQGNIHQCGQCKWCMAIFTNVGSVNDAWQCSPDLNKSGASVEVKVKVLDLSVVGKLVPHVLLLSLLVHVGHKQDPALDRCKHPTHSSAGKITTGLADSNGRAYRIQPYTSADRHFSTRINSTSTEHMHEEEEDFA